MTPGQIGVFMTDAVTKAEMEDVLSSIRKLVSETQSANKHAAQGGEVPTGKLVLTPAFRVVDDEPPRDDSPGSSGDVERRQDEAPSPAEYSEPQSQPTLPPETEAEIEVPAELEAEPEPEVEIETTAELEAELETETETETTAELEAEPEPEPDPWVMAQSDDTDESDAPQVQGEADAPTSHTDELERRLAELEAAVGADMGEWEPDGSEDPEEAAAEEVILALHAQVPDSEHPAAIEDAEVIDETAPDPGPRLREAANAAPEARPVAEGADADEVSSEGATHEAAGAQSSAVPADTPQTAAPDAGRTGAPPAEDGGDDLYLDEEALADLVTKLVREELRGHIGEQITRSVRRMVRREINRAMALREMD